MACLKPFFSNVVQYYRNKTSQLMNWNIKFIFDYKIANFCWIGFRWRGYFYAAVEWRAVNAVNGDIFPAYCPKHQAEYQHNKKTYQDLYSALRFGVTSLSRVTHVQFPATA